MSYKTRKELKNESKALLKSNWKDSILVSIIPTIFIIIGIGSFSYIFKTNATIEITNNNYTSTNAITNNTSFIINLIISLIFTLIYVGVSFSFLDWLRSPKMKIEPFKNSMQVFTNLYFTPILFINILIYIYTLLWSLLLFIPGIIKSISYSQASFIYKDLNEYSDSQDSYYQTSFICKDLNAYSDGQNLTYKDYITASRNLMNGHKWRYFVLQLSFIGWHLLAILTFGIGYIWLTPYIIATNAAFYKDLAKNNNITQ